MNGTHRHEIDGLRAVAVLAVVAFHAGIPGFAWGFWGVDVFFVLSGYLITGIIRRELGTGTFAFGAFWARRLRRLVPAAGVTIFATLMACIALASPFEWAMASSDALFATLWSLNLSLGLRDVLYFDADAEMRPFLHFWSLAVEEQFYLVWPVLLVVLHRVARRALAPSIVVVAVVGLVLSAVFSSSHPNVAFFLLPFRMWELAAGALAGFVVVESPRWRRACAWLGVGAAVAGLALLTNTTAVPGTLSALPVVATVMWIVAGRAWLGGVLLAQRPLVAVGERSYGLYLWHWPVLVLGRPLVGEGPWATTLLVVVALALAWGSHRWVEVPLRFHPRLVASARWSFAVAAMFIVLDVVAAGGLRLAARARLQSPPLQALQAVRKDAVAFDGCDDDDGCEVRPGTGATILVLGDSHAMEWVPAIVGAASGADWRVVYAGRSACPGLDVPTVRPSRRDPVFAPCRAFQARLERVVERTSPAVVVVANADGYLEDGAIVARDTDAATVLAAANQRLIAQLRGRGVGVVAVLDHPSAFEDPVRCQARGGRSCAPRVDEARGPWRTQLREAVAGAVIVDATSLMCADGVCPLQRNGVEVWRDRHHITAAFSRTTAPTFAAAVAAAMPTQQR